MSDEEASAPLNIRYLGLQPYKKTWQAMRDFTIQRTDSTTDEIWVLQHYPVYTQGLNGKSEYILNPNPIIPIIKVDRGGQITFHAQGQLIIYCLLDLKRRNLGVRALVSCMENSLVKLLQDYHITTNLRKDAPGVYVGHKKIASIGLKITKQRSYHGLSLNVKMDLAPFNDINTCGLGMEVTQLADIIEHPDITTVTRQLLKHLKFQLNESLTI